MYYKKSISSILTAIKKIAPEEVALESKLVKGEPAPLSHILWMCNKIQEMDTQSIDAAVKAGRWIGWVFAHLEMRKIFSNEQIRNMARKDNVKNFDKPH